MKRKVVSFLVAIVLFTPSLTLAAGLVPCGGEGEPVCQACHAVDILNGVLDWLVGVLSVVFALIVMVAGFNLVTSTGNTSTKEKAKSMITNAFVGFVIVLAAWLLIDYGMRFLVSDEGASVPFGTWNSVQCVDQPEVTWQQTQIDFGTIESTEDLVAAGFAPDPSLAPDAYAAGDCSPANLISHGFSAQQAQVMSCIAQPESGCNNNADAGDNGLGSTARGVFQIVYGYDDDCHSLRLSECTTANGGTPLNCGRSDDTPGSACNRAASNFACNAAAARCLLNGAPGVRPGYQHWLADHRASTQAACVARYTS
jgi:hypothetical protein